MATGFGGLVNSATTSDALTVTQNRQIALNAGGVGVSGNLGNKAVQAIGGVALQNLGGGNKSTTTVNIQNLDVAALQSANDVVHHALEYSQDTTQDALISNQTITLASQEVNRQVSIASINAANVATISALDTLRHSQDVNATLAAGAVQSAENIAGQAAPVSEGNIALAGMSQTTKIVVVVAVSVAIYLIVKKYA